MKRLDRCFALLPALCLALALSLTACGGQAASQPAEEPSSSQADAAPESGPEEDQDAMAVVSAIDVMCEPGGILFLSDGSFLVSDTYHKVIWQVENGASSLYAGGDTAADPYGRPMGGYKDAALADSRFGLPWAIAPFLDGYAVSDPDNNVVRLIRDGAVRTINGVDAGDPAVFDHPTGLAADEDGSLYVADTYHGAVRRITPEGEVSTFADGLDQPMGLCWQGGTLYIAETGANRITTVSDGRVAALAGNGDEGFADGPAAQAAFSAPQGVAAAEDGSVYVADTENGAVRLIRDGAVTTIAQRDADDLTAFIPNSPVSLGVRGDDLYVCDSFGRKVFILSLTEG